jgi:hypothetical protein
MAVVCFPHKTVSFLYYEALMIARKFKVKRLTTLQWREEVAIKSHARSKPFGLLHQEVAVCMLMPPLHPIPSHPIPPRSAPVQHPRSISRNNVSQHKCIREHAKMPVSECSVRPPSFGRQRQTSLFDGVTGTQNSRCADHTCLRELLSRR